MHYGIEKEFCLEVIDCVFDVNLLVSLIESFIKESSYAWDELN